MFLKLAVIGDPVAHSRSPELQRRLLADAGVEGSYEAIRVTTGHCAREVARLRAAGYSGLNVTTPLKEEAAALCDERDPVVERCGAANVLCFAYDRVLGANTDGIGALEAIRQAHGSDLAGRTVLVLGVGPTARAAAVAFADAGARIAVWNRTAERAAAFAAVFGAVAYDAASAYDVVFSTLPPGASIEAHLVSTIAGAGAVVDANYGDRSTLGARVGRPVWDGSIMLEAQARASFEVWRAAARSI